MSEKTNPDQKKLYNLYALFGVSLVLCVVPNASAMILCLVFFTWALIAAYMARKSSEEDSLIHNHAIFIIRSLWIGALFSVFTTIAAASYMLGNISYDPFMPCADKIAGLGIEALESMGTMEIYKLSEPCIDSFISFNKEPLMVAVAIGAVPPLLYMAYRFIKGIARASKDYRLADPKGWL